MCFQIDRTAERPGQRIAWKVVQVTCEGDVKSLIRDTTRGWWPGPRRATGPSYQVIYHGNGKPHSWLAYQGIYVYTTKHEALRNNGYQGWRSGHPYTDYAVMKVLVDPEDWLHTSQDGRTATYKKVMVPENQPYIEWY